MTKYLIVNGDDLGASPGINRGIVEAHERGILTSASLLVTTPHAEPAARQVADLPELSLGLHADLREELNQPSEGFQAIGASLQRQFSRFEELVGRPPTHIDSHHNVHRDPRALPHFLTLAHDHGLPLREHSPIRHYSKFYGQWGGQSHLEQVSVEALERMIRSEFGDGITELGCHPGYVDAGHVTSYRREREAELRTLCDPRIRRLLAEEGIALVGFHQVARMLVRPG
ncbi:MAG TPA: ChbG/HpnK family deacetylase [Thermoplasmata archaeon]|nr:ChbG/HpnK family deacetylase [Thermoplasmata archaeon]